MTVQPATIVVTGGPGGGKTTALDLFQRELRSAVKIVPEAATLLFGHGLDREVGGGHPLPLQRSIYRMQVGLEDIFRDCYPGRLLICDRGTLDGLAYWPGDERSYFESLGTTYEREAARYGAVIFFQSAAIHGEDVRSNNPYRSEDSSTAATLDERLRRVWERHPGFHYIATEPSFMRKINRGLAAIAHAMESMQAGKRE